MLYVILYLVGYVLAYYLHKWLICKAFPNTWNYNDVGRNLFMSFVWPISTPMCLLIFGIGSRLNSNKPPRWL